VGRTVKLVGKPDAGNLHVRFDERGRETERAQSIATALVLDSTQTESSSLVSLLQEAFIHTPHDPSSLAQYRNVRRFLKRYKISKRCNPYW
jgi:hypothetical protein